MRLPHLAVLTLCCLPLPLRAADLRVFPESATLTGPHTTQRLLVFATEQGRVVGDGSANTKFTTSNPAIATVSTDGTVTPTGDGEAVITATHNGKTAAARVTVTKFSEPVERSFRNHVIPLFTKLGCNGGACHGALAGKGGLKLSLRGYAPEADHFALTRQALGRRIDPVEPAQSLLLRKPTADLPHGGGQKLEEGTPNYRVLADWIAAGAPAPKDADLTLQRLEVFPTEAVLKPKDTLQVGVRAWYGDGRSEDVTGWARFSSSEDLVAGVNPAGRVEVKGNGEASISVQFGTLVASVRVVSPLPNAVEEKVFAAASRRNFIDELVLKKLQALRIPPSPDCTDSEFVRRAFLDATGTLPTPDEVQKFVGSSDPEKRAKLIDALLARPEFVDYWAYKWSDLLLVSTRKLPQPAMWAFSRFVRQSVADNKPWDRFARDILTASGNTLENGAANYFVLHKDVTDLTETTAVTFLGTSITCARCHNHPLEKWTQDQYWGMANLFARVTLKNGDRPNSVSVQAQPFGDALHPRREVAMPPAPLDAKPLLLDAPADRRAYFADWLMSPDNPYFAKALVNRVWRNFLGRGLVEAEDDLRQTNPPSNAELFDALAKDFVVHKYDVKHLIRTVMNSATYQRSSRPVPGNEGDDRFHSHYLIRRLPAEVVLDAYSQVTGVPTAFTQVQIGTTGGEQPYNGYPLGTRALQLADAQVVSRFLESFGRPERGQSCSCERQQDASVGQALHLNNGRTLNEKLRAKGSRVEQWVGEKVDDSEAVRRVFLLTLCREPNAGERKKFTALMAEAASEGPGGRRAILEDLFWAVLTSREFLFNR